MQLLSTRAKPVVYIQILTIKPTHTVDITFLSIKLIYVV